MKTLDKTKYRGKGRPRKSDYVSIERGYEDYTTPQERLNQNKTNWWDIALLSLVVLWFAYLIGKAIWS